MEHFIYEIIGAVACGLAANLFHDYVRRWLRTRVRTFFCFAVIGGIAGYCAYHAGHDLERTDDHNPSGSQSMEHGQEQKASNELGATSQKYESTPPKDVSAPSQDMTQSDPPTPNSDLNSNVNGKRKSNDVGTTQPIGKNIEPLNPKPRVLDQAASHHKKLDRAVSSPPDVRIKSVPTRVAKANDAPGVSAQQAEPPNPREVLNALRIY